MLAREYSDRAYSRLHRLTVDTYAVQHPGQPNRQAIQSVNIHLVSLCEVLERGKSLAEATKTIGLAVSKKGSYVWLDPPQSMGAITVAEVRATTTLEEHLATGQKWAQSAWAAWAPHHDTVRSRLDALGESDRGWSTSNEEPSRQ